MRSRGHPSRAGAGLSVPLHPRGHDRLDSQGHRRGPARQLGRRHLLAGRPPASLMAFRQPGLGTLRHHRPGRNTVIGHLQCVVLACPDAPGLARFYRALLGGTVNRPDPRWSLDDGWATLHTGVGQVLAFQRVDDHRPPVWPDPGRPPAAPSGHRRPGSRPCPRPGRGPGRRTDRRRWRHPQLADLHRSGRPPLLPGPRLKPQ